MKVRLIITARGWEYKLHAKRDDQGRYYAHLADQGGQPLLHGAIHGCFDSLDMIVTHAAQIHRGLVALHETAISLANKAAPAASMPRDHSSITTIPAPTAEETTTREGASAGA